MLPLQMEDLLSAHAFALKLGSWVLQTLLLLLMWEFLLKMWNVYCIPAARHYADTRLPTPTISKPHVACVDFLVLNAHGNTNTCGIFVAFLGNYWAQPCKIILPTVGSTVCGGRYCLCVLGCWSHMPRLVSHSCWVSGFPGRQIPILEPIRGWRVLWGNNKGRQKLSALEVSNGDHARKCMVRNRRSCVVSR